MKKVIIILFPLFLFSCKTTQTDEQKAIDLFSSIMIDGQPGGEVAVKAIYPYDDYNLDQIYFLWLVARDSEDGITALILNKYIQETASISEDAPYKIVHYCLTVREVSSEFLIIFDREIDYMIADLKPLFLRSAQDVISYMKNNYR